MAEKIALELDINAKGATTSLGQLEQEAERLNEELRKVPLGSKAFKDLKTELVGVNKEIKNTELSMEALDNEQVASELGSVAGAVGDVSAAFVLLGGGGGAIEETVQNIEKAIGISMAFKGTIEGTQSAMKLFNNVVKNSTTLQKANNATTVLAAGIMKLFTGSVNTTSVAFKGLRAAIAATGIGLLVVGVGALVANFDKIKSALSGVSEAAKDLQKATSLRVQTNQKNVDLLDNQTNILKLQGKTERQILKMKIDAQKALIQSLIEEMNAQKIINDERISGEQRNQKILQKTLELILIVPRTLTKIINLAGEGFIELTNKITQSSIGKKLLGLEPIEINLDLDKKADELLEKATKFIFDPEEAQKEADEQFKVLEENLLKQKNTLAGFQLQVLDLDKKAAADKKAEDDKAADERKRAADKAQAEADKKAAEARAKTLEERAKEAQDLADFLLDKEELENEFFNRKLSKEQIEINAVLDKYNTLIEQAKIFGEDSKILEEAQQAEINEIKKRFADEELARQIEIQERNKQFSIDTTAQILNTFADLSQQTLDSFNRMNNTILNNEKLTNKEKSKLLAANNKRAKKAFDRQKAAQIAGALMTTYSSANSAYQSQFLPVPDPSSPVRGAIAAGAAIFAGLANVNKIRQQKFEAATLAGGGGGGGYDGAGGGGEAPLLAPANTNTLVPQNNTRVFVTETDITATQNQVAVIQGQATIR